MQIFMEAQAYLLNLRGFCLLDMGLLVQSWLWTGQSNILCSHWVWMTTRIYLWNVVLQSSKLHSPGNCNIVTVLMRLLFNPRIAVQRKPNLCLCKEKEEIQELLARVRYIEFNIHSNQLLTYIYMFEALHSNISWDSVRASYQALYHASILLLP